MSMPKGANLSELLPLPPEGLMPAIVQDAASGAVLMLITLNREALDLITATGLVHYYHPRKRKVLRKGESSGHSQEVVEIRLNCAGDQLLLRVSPRGGACEWGYQSCFFRTLTADGWEIADPRVFDPEEVYPEFAFSH
jgi:phosphoribosyl-AMP cyclohydrolase